ncbi:uncharacterized protein METZ01_LOCUS361696 [marine metagenome]|uniref:Uncharacterized protein n=1 Tax=marine metagenome TaxID=408172 RepID=A0A382SGY3_9ZZZZ
MAYENRMSIVDNESEVSTRTALHDL